MRQGRDKKSVVGQTNPKIQAVEHHLKFSLLLIKTEVIYEY